MLGLDSMALHKSGLRPDLVYLEMLRDLDRNQRRILSRMWMEIKPGKKQNITLQCCI